jgi:hypothetical protein
MGKSLMGGFLPSSLIGWGARTLKAPFERNHRRDRNDETIVLWETDQPFLLRLCNSILGQKVSKVSFFRIMFRWSKMP